MSNYKHPLHLLGLGLALALGCGVDRSIFTHSICDEGLKIAGELDVMGELDYLALRLSYDDEDFTSTLQELAVFGEPCATASDREACLDALSSLPERSMLSQSTPLDTRYHTVAWTRGDELGVALTAEEVLALVGPVDRDAEAAFVATALFHDIICDGDDNIAVVDDGYILLTRSRGACGYYAEHVIFASTSGDIETLETKVLRRDDRGCES